MYVHELQQLIEHLPQKDALSVRAELSAILASAGADPDELYRDLEICSPHVESRRDQYIPGLPMGQFMKLHSHRFYEIIFCHNPAGVEYLIGTDRFRLEAGDVIFVPPGVSHTPLITDAPSNHYTRDVIWVRPELMDRIASLHMNCTPEQYIPAYLCRGGQAYDAQLRELFARNVQEDSRRETGWETMLIGNTVVILSLLHRICSEQQPRPYLPKKAGLLDQVLSYVEEHLSEKITLAEVAKAFYVSESTISQTFRKKMGISFYRLVTLRRLVRAKNMIDAGFPLEAVAERVGFSDYSTFFRAFKQEYGISPRQYRRGTPVTAEAVGADSD